MSKDEKNLEEPFRILQARIVISAVKSEQYPPEVWPEVALAGRSNVGKSSMINRIVNRRNLARTSSTPGKTQTINFYAINEKYSLVDLPGYGYAKVSKTQKAGWGPMMERYMTSRPQLRAVIQLIDIRHPPSNEDKQMQQWLQHIGIPSPIVATKADKISKGRRAQHIKVIRQELQVPKDIPILAFSAHSGEGTEDLLDLVAYLWEDMMEIQEESVD